MTIQLEETSTKGAAFIEEDNKRLAEMTYSIASPTLIIIDHTPSETKWQIFSLLFAFFIIT